jgi:nitric oxide reductase large subunit
MDGDAFPTDPAEWKDSDSDGVGDNTDIYPEDPAKWEKVTAVKEEKESNYIPMISVLIALIVIMLLTYMFLQKREKEHTIKRPKMQYQTKKIKKISKK